MHTLPTNDTTIGPTHVATSLATPNAYQPTTATTLGTTCYLGRAQEHWGSVRQPGRMPDSHSRASPLLFHSIALLPNKYSLASLIKLFLLLLSSRSFSILSLSYPCLIFTYLLSDDGKRAELSKQESKTRRI